MSYKAVLFDMDGTLLDTLEDLRDSTNHVLRQMGYPERSLEEMRRFVGNGAEKQIRRAVPEGTSEEKIMETLAAYRAYYQDHCQIKTKVYDGLLDVLSELKEKGVNCELHIFPDGGHGLALANEFTQDKGGYGIQRECVVWIELVKTWLGNKFGFGESL